MAVATRSAREDSDRLQPPLDELRPLRDRILRSAEAERMSAIRIEMHLGGDVCVLERDVIHERLVDIIDAIGLRLEEESRRRVSRHVDIRIEYVLPATPHPEMARVE